MAVCWNLTGKFPFKWKRVILTCKKPKSMDFWRLKRRHKIKADGLLLSPKGWQTVFHSCNTRLLHVDAKLPLFFLWIMWNYIVIFIFIFGTVLARGRRRQTARAWGWRLRYGPWIAVVHSGERFGVGFVLGDIRIDTFQSFHSSLLHGRKTNSDVWWKAGIQVKPPTCL